MIIRRKWLREALFKNRKQLRAALFATVLGFILQIFVSLFPMVVYNKVIPNSAYQSLLTVALGMLIIITFDFIFKLIKTRIIDLATSNLELNLQKSLYEKVISWDLQNIPKLTGSSAALTRDLDNVAELFTTSSITVLVGLPFVLINLGVIYLIAADLAVVATVICLLIFIVSLVYYFIVSSRAEEAKNTSIEKNSVFIETLNNLETIKSVGDYEFFKQRWNKAIKNNNNVASS